MRKHRFTGIWMAWLAIVGLALVGFLNPAFADTNVTGHAIGVYSNVSQNGDTLMFWAGAYTTDKGLAFCVQPSKGSPIGAPLGDPQELTSFVNDQGDALTTAQLNQLAYVAWKASLNPNASDQDAIIYKLVMMTIIGYTSVQLSTVSALHDLSLDDPKSDAVKIANDYGVLDAAKALLAEARAKANNWDGTGQFALTKPLPSKPGDTLAGTAKLPGLGTGFPVEFRVTGPDGKTDVVTSNTSNDIATFKYKTTAFGTYRVEARLGQPAPPRFPLIAAAGNKTQSLLLLTAEPRTWAGRTTVFDVARPNPTITTSISQQIMLPGQKISDKVVLGGLVNDAVTTYEVSSALYEAPASSDGNCPSPNDAAWKNASLIAKTAAKAVPASAINAGSATLTLGAWTVPADKADACVSYGESVTMLVDGRPMVTANHSPGDVAQTGVILPSPAIATQVSSQMALPGDTISDTVALSGLTSGHGASYTVTGGLYGTPPVDGACPTPDAAAWKTAKAVATIADTAVPATAIRADGTASLTLGKWRVPADQTAVCVSYGETVTMTVAGKVMATAEHPAGATTQTSLYWPAPSIATQISGQIAMPGETIHDTVHLAGLANNPAVTYEVSGGLYQVPPLDDWTCPGPEAKAWQLADTVLAIDPVDVTPTADTGQQNGERDIVLGEWTVPDTMDATCVSYGETVVMRMPGHADIRVDHPAGAPDQTGRVLPKATISTQISLTAVKADDTLSDTVTLTALNPTEQFGYSLTGELVGAPALADLACPGEGDEAWSKGDVLTTFSATIAPEQMNDGQAVLPGLGEWQVPSGNSPLCVTYKETLTMTVPGRDPVVIEHQAGLPAQTARFLPFEAQTGGTAGLSGGAMALVLSGLGGLTAGAWLVRRFIWHS